MKETATPCMIVATIIASVVFGAAFTVPGGINGDSGIPIFLQSNYFMAFVVSDAMALFFSTTSIVMFLSILTSSYNEEDFLIALPRTLIIGLGALFISVAAMVTAFSAGLYIVLGHRVKWVIFPITLLACLPLSSFALLQFPLFVKIIHSTYGSPIFEQNGEPKV
ncbi:PREDICTED: uncharacterized protein LOC109114081 [Nelumbo nucifera]|nr:PREDICTED: uncharacterized protein LOC109114081 [Nelumbo nucifera]DAD38504.1 TPA_asm: hypothetical protein HUJ06_009145 [Nelumbo nucifera]